MGDAEDLKAEGTAEILNSMAMVDRYNYDQQRAGFYYNSDPKCRSEHDLEEDKKYVVYFNGVNSLPYHLTLDEDYINFEQLMFTLNTSIVKGTPRWSQRSYSALFDFYMNGIVFMMEEGSLTRVVESKDDWRVALMAKITEWTQENESLFIPIIQNWDLEAESARTPSLAGILDAKKDEIPHIYLLHSYSGRSIMYPEMLEEVNNFSPELIMAWAQLSVLEIELEGYRADLTWTPPQVEEGEEEIPELTDEMKEDI